MPEPFHSPCPPQYLVRDLRRRTVNAVRSRPRQATAELEEEWRCIIQRVIDTFGVHPFIAYVYKEHGNCLFDMGRHGECLAAYESAKEHLRGDISNMQLAKLLCLWGSTEGRLGLQGAKAKLNQALSMAKDRDPEIERMARKNLEELDTNGGTLKSFGAGGKEACKWGRECRNNRYGRCQYEHAPDSAVSGASGRPSTLVPGRGGSKPACKWGEECRNNQRGKCIYFHPRVKPAGSYDQIYISMLLFVN